LTVPTYVKIERIIYLIVGVVITLIAGVVILGDAEKTVFLIQLLPGFIPILIILGVIRWILSPQGRAASILKETWASLSIATIILILALWAMLFFAFL